MSVKSGLDVFLEAPDISGPVGLLATVASQTQDRRTALRALTEAGVRVTAVFAPEHGYYGFGAAGEEIDDERVGDIPVYSLYGKADSPERNERIVHGLSLVFVDLQDLGLRWYTFINALQKMLKACAAAGVPLWVLDRPNPLGGVVVEGPLPEPEYLSVVASASVPIRHGLTLGELAQWINREIGAQLDVIPMSGWRRDMYFGDTGLHWVAPSPGIPHPMTALIYSGTCLMEGLEVNEGRGTASPFEQFGAPYIIGEMLADELNLLDLPGVVFSPVWFRPVAGKFQGERCKGVRITVTNTLAFRGFAIGLHIVNLLRKLYPEQATWVRVNESYWFDRLVGNYHIREEIDEGVRISDILASYSQDVQVFQSESGESWLYD